MRKTSLGIWLIAACSFVIAVGLSLSLSPAASAQESRVDVAIVLAIDVSFSVDANEYRQQMQGLGNAFLKAEVKKGGPNDFKFDLQSK